MALAVSVAWAAPQTVVESERTAGAPSPPWSVVAEAELRSAIAEAPRHGLSPKPFQVLLPQPGAPDRDARLRAAAAAYARALALGATDPHRIFDIYTLERPEPDLEAGLAAALQEGRLRAWLDDLPRRMRNTEACRRPISARPAAWG
ncbi:hypothetical protein [Phenylobacterium sp.]|uniref:hypothetical protein n=1 Tax=Phenylobacterium sp. TaxID=1871053 RepID=UPI0035B3E846